MIRKQKLKKSSIIFSIILLFLFIVSKARAQNVALENSIFQVKAYPCISNYLEIIVEEIPCGNTFVTTDNGTVEKLENCTYKFTPIRVGFASLQINKIQNGDTVLVLEKKCKILEWPKHEASIGRNKSGKVNIGEFKAQQGIRVPITNFNISGDLTVLSFKIQLIRKGELIIEGLNQSQTFDPQTRKIINRATFGDIVIFDDIMLIMPGSEKEIKLDKLTIEII